MTPLADRVKARLQSPIVIGTAVLLYADIPVGYNDAVGPSWKFGLSKSPSDKSVAVQYGNVEHGTASLLDRVANALPVS